MNIDQQIAAVIAREGGYVNNPADRGGPTRFGITQAVARANGYDGDMRALPQPLAATIYRKRYWIEPHFDVVATRAPLVAAELFDTGVNSGPPQATMFLQQALNTLQGTVLKRDGVMLPGGATLQTLDAYLAARRAQDGEHVLVELLNVEQGSFYAGLVDQHPRQREFVFGWIRNRVMERAA